MQQVSNRLKKSRLHGNNRTISYYRIKIKRGKWYKVRRKRIRYKARTNNKRMSPLSYITKRYVRLRTLARMALFNRLYWKSLYPGVNVTKIRLDRHYKMRDNCSHGESILWKVESRLDVSLWRSGMVSTIRIAKQLVRSNKVELYSNGVWKVVNRADKLLTSNIVLKLTTWDQLRKVSEMKWKDKRYKHKVPNYLIVDYHNGIITMVHKPKDGEVRAPSYLPIRVVSLMKRG
jgi:ribosomal protein S4